MRCYECMDIFLVNNYFSILVVARSKFIHRSLDYKPHHTIIIIRHRPKLLDLGNLLPGRHLTYKLIPFHCKPTKISCSFSFVYCADTDIVPFIIIINIIYFGVQKTATNKA